jgi:small-conductance mechanosensitive channel
METSLQDILAFQLGGNTMEHYLVFLGTVLGAVLAIKLVEVFVVARLKRWAAHTETQIDDFILERLPADLNPLFYTVVGFFALKQLHIHEHLVKIVNGSLIALGTFFAVHFLAGFVTFVLSERWLRSDQSDFRAKNVKGLLTLIRGAIWALGVVFLLDNLGFQISAIITGLGIGGVAVALAAQAVLGDLFSYISIVFDRPFEVGDAIHVGDFQGTVEHVGMKTTRLRSVNGEQIVIANSDLTSSRIRNFKRMEQRRIVFKFGVTYDTPPAVLRDIPAVVKAAIEANAGAKADRVHFASFSPSSLDFECVYFVDTADYAKAMDVQQAVNLTLREEFELRGIGFAFPTQTIRVQGS